jgi:hypothetical protein
VSTESKAIACINLGNACYHSVQKLFIKSIISYVPLYCENVFENREMRIFGPKIMEVVGVWRVMHNEKLHNLNPSPNIIKVIKSRKIRWAGHVAHVGKMRNAYKLFVGKHERKRPFERPGCRREDNIRMDLRETEWGGVCGLNSSDSGTSGRSLRIR